MAKKRRASGRGDNAPFGCAAILLLFAGLIIFLGYTNHQWWLQRQEQIPRFQPVRARVDDKGIARYDSRDSKGKTTTTYQKWIHFTCRIAGQPRDGARLTLSGSDMGWESFQKGQDYDAFYDPVANECVLLIDEKVGDPDHGFRSFLTIAGVMAAVSLLLVGVGLMLRRRPSRVTLLSE